jgi:hypothetical protein
VFVKAVANCLVIVPLLSWHEEEGQEPGGSVGQLMALHTEDKVDYFLLEIIIANALMALPSDNRWLRAIEPIFVGKLDSQGYTDFPFENIARLPSVPSLKTSRRAAEILISLGLPVDTNVISFSVKEHISRITLLQGIHLSKLGSEENCSKGASKDLVDVVASLQGHGELLALLERGLLEGAVERDLIDEMSDLRRQIGSLETKLSKMNKGQTAAAGTAVKESRRASPLAAVETRTASEAAEAAEAVEAAEAIEAAAAVEAAAAAPSREQLKKILQDFEEVKNATASCLREVGEFKSVTNLCLSELKEKVESDVGVSDAAEGGITPELEEFLRREIQNVRDETASVLRQLQVFEEHVSDRLNEQSVVKEEDPELAGVPLDIKELIHDLRGSLNKQIGHERDSRTEFENRIQSHLDQTVTHHDVALVTNAATEAKEVNYICGFIHAKQNSMALSSCCRQK